jgi:hypothetical protein
MKIPFSANGRKGIFYEKSILGNVSTRFQKWLLCHTNSLFPKNGTIVNLVEKHN